MINEAHRKLVTDAVSDLVRALSDSYAMAPGDIETIQNFRNELLGRLQRTLVVDQLSLSYPLKLLVPRGSEPASVVIEIGFSIAVKASVSTPFKATETKQGEPICPE